MAANWFKQLVYRVFTTGNECTTVINGAELAKKLNYSFKDIEILQQALKHRSYLAASGEKRVASNERLELLGDAVLGLVVTDYLYRKYPNETEGILTNYKSMLVSGRLLVEVAKELELGQFLLLNDSEARSGGRKRTSILSDVVEAIIGAIYLDGGIEQAQRFIHANVTKRLDEVLNDGRLRNNKSLLQEYCQGMGMNGPHYRVEEEAGPDHKKIFTVSVHVDGRVRGVGKGTSKKKAEQNAASEALHQMELV